MCSAIFVQQQVPDIHWDGSRYPLLVYCTSLQALFFGGDHWRLYIVEMSIDYQIKVDTHRRDPFRSSSIIILRNMPMCFYKSINGTYMYGSAT